MRTFGISICKTFTFDAAHSLRYHDGICSNLHGHTYSLEVEVTGDRHELRIGGPKRGMVVDFGDLGTVVKQSVIILLDHSCLNDLTATFNPTAENLLKWIRGRLNKPVKGIGARLVRLRLYETPSNYAEWKL